MKIQEDQAHKVLSTEQLSPSSSSTSMSPSRKIRAEPACSGRGDAAVIGMVSSVKRRDLTMCYPEEQTRQDWLAGIRDPSEAFSCPRKWALLCSPGKSTAAQLEGDPRPHGMVKGAEQLPCQGTGIQPWRPSKECSTLSEF